MDALEEQELVLRCRAGEAVAWDRFFDEHYAAIGRLVCQLVPDATPEDSEEICQDTFLAAIRNLESFGGRSRLKTWLFRIAVNKARDFRDRRLAAKRGGGRLPASLDVEDPTSGERLDPPSAGRSPDQEMASAEAMREVRRALDLLGGPCREILELRYFGELDYEAIGQHLGAPVKTVSSRLSRCLDKLGLLLSAGAPEEARRPAV